MACCSRIVMAKLESSLGKLVKAETNETTGRNAIRNLPFRSLIALSTPGQQETLALLLQTGHSNRLRIGAAAAESCVVE